MATRRAHGEGAMTFNIGNQSGGVINNVAGAHAEVAELDDALRSERPDRPRFARALERLTRLLAAAGSLASGGAALLAPLHALAGWLGALGAPILGLLPALL